MKLQNLISKLEKHHKKKIDLTLGRTYSLLKKLGNPQDKLQNIINVVGTNSKASMAYSLKSIKQKLFNPLYFNRRQTKLLSDSTLGIDARRLFKALNL